MKKWSKSETDKLIEAYPFVLNKILSIMLNRSEVSIQKKALHLGLKKNNEFISAIKSYDRQGEKCCAWKGGRKTTLKGYILVLDKTNPDSDTNGYILEHRKIMAEHLGRRLKSEEIIHHINGNPKDNRIENLEIMKASEHIKHHHIGAKRNSESKKTMSKAAKERFKNPENHPMYKNIPLNEIIEKRENGMTVNEICNYYGISNKTYYNKLRG